MSVSFPSVIPRHPMIKGRKLLNKKTTRRKSVRFSLSIGCTGRNKHGKLREDKKNLNIKT